MKFSVTMSGSNRSDGLEINAGESVEIALTWKDVDGTPRDMAAATVTARVLDPSKQEIAGVATVAADKASLSIGAGSTAAWSGQYVIEVIETRAGVVSTGRFVLRVS